MRQLYVFNMVTLDGFFEGPNRDISWHNVDEEFNELAADQLDKTDLLLFGRLTYELMAGYWPTPTAIANDPIIAGKMNSLSKIVFSRTLIKADWNNTRLVNKNISEELLKLKQQSGKEIAIFGSSDLMASLMHTNLIDEYRIMINPVVLGHGRPLFNGISSKLNLTLLNSQRFRSGNVFLCYRPAPKE
jgi:dihydrofolate reductase